MYTRKRRTKRKRGGDPGLIAIAAVGAAALLATSFYLEAKDAKAEADSKKPKKNEWWKR